MTSARIELAPAAVDALNRPVNGSGGFQSLLREIQRRSTTGRSSYSMPVWSSELLVTSSSMVRAGSKVDWSTFWRNYVD